MKNSNCQSSSSLRKLRAIGYDPRKKVALTRGDYVVLVADSEEFSQQPGLLGVTSFSTPYQVETREGKTAGPAARTQLGIMKPSIEEDGSSYPSGFFSRCVFRLVLNTGLEKDGQIIFGTTVRLVLVGIGDNNSLTMGQKMGASSWNCSLSKGLRGDTTFTIEPQLKMNRQGEGIRSDEKILLQHISQKEHKTLYLAPSQASDAGTLGGQQPGAVYLQEGRQYGWRIRLFLKERHTVDQTIFSGSVLRLFNREEEGNLSVEATSAEITKDGEGEQESVLGTQVRCSPFSQSYSSMNIISKQLSLQDTEEPLENGEAEPEAPLLISQLSDRSLIVLNVTEENKRSAYRRRKAVVVNFESQSKENQDHFWMDFSWEIITEDNQQNAEISWGEAFMLKHMVTELFLTIVEGPNGEMLCRLCPRKAFPNQTFEFVPVYDQKHRAKCRRYVFLRNKQTEMYLDLQKNKSAENKFLVSVSTHPPDADTFKCMPMKDSVIFQYLTAKELMEGFKAEVKKMATAGYLDQVITWKNGVIASIEGSQNFKASFLTPPPSLSSLVPRVPSLSQFCQTISINDLRQTLCSLIAFVVGEEDAARALLNGWLKVDSNEGVSDRSVAVMMRKEMANSSGINQSRLPVVEVHPCQEHQRVLLVQGAIECILQFVCGIIAVLESNKSQKHTKVHHQLHGLSMLAYYLLSNILKANDPAMKQLFKIGGLKVITYHLGLGFNAPMEEILHCNSLQDVSKSDIFSLFKQIVLSVEVGKVPDHNLVGFIAKICAQDGKAARDKQEEVLDLMLNFQLFSSGALYLTYIKYDTYHHSQPEVMISTKFKVPNDAEEETEYNPRLQRHTSDMITWLSAAVVDGEMVHERFREGVKLNEDEELLRRARQELHYYKSILTLYTALCCGANPEGQARVRRMISAEQILLILDDVRYNIDMGLKAKLVDLLRVLYVHALPTFRVPDLMDDNPFEFYHAKKSYEARPLVQRRADAEQHDFDKVFSIKTHLNIPDFSSLQLNAFQTEQLERKFDQLLQETCASMQSHSTDYIFDFEVKLKHTQLLLQETIRPSLLSNTQEDHGNPMTKNDLQTLKQTIKKVYYELNKWSYVQRDRLRQWIIYTLTKITAVGPKGREDDDSYYEVPEIAWDLLPSEIQDQFKTESQLPDDLPIDLEANQTFALSFLHLMQELMAVDFFSATYNIPPELSCDGTAKWTLADTHANASGSLPKLRRRVDISSSYSTTEVFYEGWMPDVCYSQVSEDGASYDQIFFALADLLRHSDPGWLLSSEQYQSMGEFLETGASFFSSVYLIGSDKGSRIVQAKREICKLLQSIIALKQKKRLLILWEKVFQPLYLEHIEEALWNADDGALLDSVLPYECDRDSSKCQENFSTAVSKVLGLILVPETERRTFSSPLSSPDNSVALMWKSKSTETQVCELRNLCNPDDSTKMVNEEVLRILMQLGLYKKDDLMESMIILLYQLFNKRVDLIEQAKALKPTLDIEEKQTLHLIRQSKAIIKAAFDDDTFHLLGQSQECKPLETKIRKAHLSLFNKQVDWHDQCAAGLINLCYHSLWEITDDVTGRSFETDHELANFKAKREEILEQLGISATVLDQLASTSFLTKTAKSMREDQETVVGIHDQEYFIWEPNPLLACKRNQNMMREEGLHEIVMEFLQKHLKDNQYEHSEAQLYTFELCFEFLYFFCWENPENCQAVSTKSFLLLIFDRLHHGEPAPVYLLEVLTKHLPVVFTILDQKAVEDIIEMITSKLEKSNPEYDLQLLELLLTMVQNDTDPLGSERSKSIAWELMQRIPVSNVKAPLDASITGRTSRMDKSVSRRVSFQSPDRTYEFEKLKLSYGRFSPVRRQNLQNDVNQDVNNQRAMLRTVAKKLTVGSLMAQVAGAAQMRKKLDEEAQGLDPSNGKQLKLEKDSKYDCSTPMTRQRAQFHLIYLELLGNLCCMDNVRSDISDYCVRFLSIPDALEALAQSEIDIDIMTALTVYMNGTYFSTHLKDNLWSQHSMKMFEPVLYCYLDVIEQHQHMIRSNDCDSILFQKYEQCITNGIFPLLTNFLKGDWPLVSEEEMVQKRFGKRSRNPSSYTTFNMGGNSDTPDELFSPSQPKLTSTNSTKMSFFGASDKLKLQSPRNYFIKSSKSKTTRMDFVDESKEDPVVVKPTFDTAQPLLPELICGIIRTCLRYGGSSFLDMQDPGFQGLQTWTKGQELLANFFCLADTSGGPPAILNRELCPDDDKDDDFLIREGMDGVKFDSKLKDDITALYDFCNHRKSANSGDGQVAYGRNSEKIRRRMEEYVYNKGWINFANILERFLDTSLVGDHIQGSPKDCVSHGDSFSPEVKQVATVMRKTIVNYNRFKNEKHGDGLELSTTKNRFFGVAQILPIDKKIQASDHYKRWSRNNSAALENLLGHLCCSVTKVHRPYDPFFMELFTLVVTPDPVRKSKLDFLPNCINPPIEGDHLDADQARSALMELGCQRLVLRLIAFAKNIESDAASSSSKKHKVMLIEAITFACKLLHDGDEEIQEKFFLAFHESRDLDSKDNELGSGFFFGVKAILEHFLERLVEETQNCEAPCGQEVDGSCYPSLEEYDFSGSEKWNQTRNYNRISNEFMISCDLVTRALRMLQLLCEGNNMKAKNLMREQGTRDTVNIVAEVTMLIKTLCMHIGNEFHYVKGKRFNKYVAETIVEGSLDPAIKRKTVAWYCPYIRFKFLRSMIEVCSQAMATLTELVQGPCERNQLVAGKSRITQVVGPLFTYFGAVQQLYTTDVWDKGKKMNAIWSGVDPYELCKSYKAEMKSFIETFKVDDQWKDDFDEWKWIEETGFIKQAQEHRRKWLEGVRTMPVQGVPESNIYLKIHGLLEVIVPFERDVLGLCNALLEGSHPPHEILDGFHEDLSPEIFIDNLVMHWKPLDQNLQRRSKLRNPLQSQISDWRSNLGNNGEAHGKSDIWWRKEKLFLYMQVFSMLRAFPGGEEFGRVFEILQRKNLMNLSDHLCKVEIISDSRNIQVVYFPKPEIVQRLWGRVEIAKKRNEIVYPSSMAKRDNPEEKLRLFLLQVQGLVGMLREFQMLEGMHNPSDKSLIKWLNPIRWCRQLLALVFQLGDFITVGQVIVNIILNLMILFEAEVGDNGEVEAFHSDGILRTIFDMVTYIHLFCTAFMWISYSLQFVFIGVPDKLHSLDREKDCIFPEIVEKWIFCGKRVFPSDALLYPIFFFQDPGIWYYSCFLGISLYACIKYPVYYAFGLVDLVRQSKLMKYVLQSVTCNLGQVVISICLCFIIMYMISVFAMIREDYRNLYTFEDHINCLDLYSCFMSHLTYGLMSPPIWTTHGFPLDSNPTYDKVFFTVLYVLTINLIFTAIVSGIIIDSFSEMRATMNEISEDARGRCFICHIEKDVFEQHNKDFDNHVKHEHNMWHYLWFKIYLEDKEESEYTGLEQCVKEHFDRQEISFFPIKRAKTFDMDEDEAEKDKVVQKLEIIEEQHNQMHRSLEKCSTQLLELSKSVQTQGTKMDCLFTQPLPASHSDNLAEVVEERLNALQNQIMQQLEQNSTAIQETKYASTQQSHHISQLHQHLQTIHENLQRKSSKSDANRIEQQLQVITQSMGINLPRRPVLPRDF